MATDDKILKVLEAIQQGQKQQEKRLDALQADITAMKTTQQEHTNTLQDHTRRLQGIKQVLTRVRKEVHIITGDFDLRIVENRRSIDQIKAQLNKSKN